MLILELNHDSIPEGRTSDSHMGPKNKNAPTASSVEANQAMKRDHDAQPATAG